MKTRKEPSGHFGLSNWGAPVPLAAMGDLGEKQVWGGSRVPLCLDMLSLRCLLGLYVERNDGPLDRHVWNSGMWAGLKISFENPQEAGSVTQTPCLLPCLGSSHNRYGKFPVALLRKVETVFLGLSH